MSSTPHVIVVGAGMGGLAAACELAAGGADVTLLERHSTPGGKMRQLLVGEAAIDSGPTVFTMRWIFDDLFKAAGTTLEDHLTLHAEDRLARHSWLDGSELDLFANMDRSVEAIDHFAGRREANAYRQFATRCQRIFETLDESFMRKEKPSPVELAFSLGVGGVPRLYDTKPFTSLWTELGTIFSDPRLQQLFGRYATYCGSSPFDAPATLMLIAHAERAGVFIVDGGMQSLANALAALAQHHGASVHYDSHVTQLLLTRGRVSGVELESGETLRADAVVFNGDTAALSRGLLGKPAKKATRNNTESSLSAVTWSLVGQPVGYDLAHHTVFFGDDYPDEFNQLFTHQNITENPTIYVCAQDRGPGRERSTKDKHGELERVFCLMNAPARRLNEAEKKDYQQRVVDRLGQHGLEFENVEDDSRFTTPNDFGRLFPGTDGALYGRPTHGWNGSFARPGSAANVRGLYFAGGSVHPGPGVPMTAMSGRLAAQRVLKSLK